MRGYVCDNRYQYWITWNDTSGPSETFAARLSGKSYFCCVVSLWYTICFELVNVPCLSVNTHDKSDTQKCSTRPVIRYFFVRGFVGALSRLISRTAAFLGKEWCVVQNNTHARTTSTQLPHIRVHHSALYFVSAGFQEKEGGPNPSCTNSYTTSREGLVPCLQVWGRKLHGWRRLSHRALRMVGLFPGLEVRAAE